ncbi:sigma-70 family RNA polymerase sigma factor [Alienimonas sp. DA493]|uniref:sigma-70 family RNA polymerase sigma factor n=1 Tax=Alienimonas sp. DA493 TaxID=3373605 RepID=UPI003754A4D1
MPETPPAAAPPVDPTAVEPGADRERMDEFARLLGGAQRRLFLYLMGLLGDRTAAEDVLQETNLVLWREFEQFEPGTNFTAWSCRVAFNQVRAHRTKRGRDRLVFSDAFLSAVDEELTREADRLEERRAALADCLNRLPDHHRELVRRRYLGERDAGTEELARRLEKSPDAVLRMLSRIRRSLHECVSRTLSGAGDGLPTEASVV